METERVNSPAGALMRLSWFNVELCVIAQHTLKASASQVTRVKRV